LIHEDIICRVLDEAARYGADFAELYVEDTHTNTISMTDLHVEDANYVRKRGAGVRVAIGIVQSYAYTADLSQDGLLSCVRAACAALPKADAAITQAARALRTYGMQEKQHFSTVTNDARVEIVRDMCAAAKDYSPLVVQTAGSYVDVTSHVFVANNFGLRAYDVRPRTRVSVQAIAGDGNSTQTGSQSPGFGMGFEAYENFDAAAYGASAAKTAVTMLQAPECPAGVVPVVIGNGFGGVIFHEACAHALEATSVARGASVFADKMGQQIASACVTAIDDGTMAGEWGSIGMDDEGMPTRRNVLIENGILKGYLVDTINGRRMHAAPTGSARRQGYDYAPTSRMTNTFIALGTDDKDEMIATMGEGLYAKKMGGGSVNPMTGEFNFAVLEGYWVRDGKIVHPVRGATLIGKGADVLMKIDRVGQDFAMGQGMCGSSSGSLPVNVGQPTIRVQDMIVGGKGGNV